MVGFISERYPEATFCLAVPVLRSFPVAIWSRL